MAASMGISRGHQTRQGGGREGRLPSLPLAALPHLSQALHVRVAPEVELAPVGELRGKGTAGGRHALRAHGSMPSGRHGEETAGGRHALRTGREA